MTNARLRKATVEIREVELSRKILEQARLLDYTQLIKRFGSMEEARKVTLGWISGRTLPKRLDEWSFYAVLNTVDGDLFLYQAHPEVQDKHPQLYI